MDGSNLNVVTTGDAGKVNHAKPKARVDDKNVQNVDFLDIVNRLSAKQAHSTPKAAKAAGTAKGEAAKVNETSAADEPEDVTADSEVMSTLDEIISEYGAEHLNADILMELMSMYTADSSVEALVSSDDPMETVRSRLYTAVLDQTPILGTGGEMIDEVADGYFDDLINVMSSSKAVSSLLEVLSTVQDADEFERALKTISGITVTSEINEVDRTVNVLSEQLNLSKAVMSAKASIENGEQEQQVPDESYAQPQPEESRAAKTQQPAAVQPAAHKKAQAAEQTAQTADTPDTPDSTAAQAMGFVDYGRGITPKEVLTEGTPEERAVFDQTLDLLSRAITEERQLYTARLHPEGLGEIIIRMEKSSSGVVFDILATNERTAQMINQKLAQLQTGMSEYEAKINPAVVTSASNAESMSGFGFDDFTGGFAGSGENAYSGNRQRAGTRYTEAGEDEREAKTTGYRTTDILNKTI
ncbi:MAG: flagellar hook-length control protein FliK [Ruminococcus sp.]|nr:flagellar hook-length control protein FliK [Ruminococcus sp.]